MPMTGWTGIMVPAETSPAIIHTIADAAGASQPESVKEAEGLGLITSNHESEEFGEFFSGAVARLKLLSKERQVKMG